MLSIINELASDSRIKLSVILMTEEEKKLAIEHGIDFIMLDDFTNKKRNMNFDLAWGLEPLINAIDTIKPDLFIAIEVNLILRNAIRYCKQRKIPNLIIQHGTPNKYSLHAFIPFEGDCFAAWGDFSKDMLVENCVSPSKIVVTGGVPFDRTLAIIPDKIKIAQELGIDYKKKWIVFTTQGVGAGDRPTVEEIFTGVTEITKASLKKKDCQLIFQVHPGQSIDEIKSIVESVSNHTAIVVRYKDTEELIAASEGMITFFSTTAIDAVILSKPLLLIKLTADEDFFPFVKMGVAIGAYEGHKIGKAFENLLSQHEISTTNYQNAANYVNYQNDGKAIKRVMQLCYERLAMVDVKGGNE